MVQLNENIRIDAAIFMHPNLGKPLAMLMRLMIL